MQHFNDLETLDDGLTESIATMSLGPLSFMSLPGEVRLNIYCYMFKSNENIPLLINSSGYIEHVPGTGLYLSCLRVSRAFYFEACPVLYGINTFEITPYRMQKLRIFKQSSRICIERAFIKVGQEIIRNKEQNLVDFDIIGTALPYLQQIEVISLLPSPLLENVLRLSESLPCSPIRKWPTLELHIEVPIEGSNKSERADTLATSHSDKLKSSFKLCQLSKHSALGLGHEMPEFKAVQIKGQLSLRLCQLLDEHTCRYGDCSFKKEIIRKGDVLKEVTEERKYTWKRSDQENLAEKEGDICAEMHQWVPSLSKEWYRMLVEEGCDIGKYQYNDPIVEAARSQA